ncbi:L,D-transpeptidase family protein [Luteolibacter yonseiensis]|uniref:L,D-transpeptidase family protein n=1 Tax=Luteolibacter yonseiensis TaxID=1144680 RepID=A0A934R539_9BACT|nr:L,D-transpeptidase family protein [Luteolibacter yonseiensis]MBK1817109.1 L,D-transpeptidase family protein [Luteolibacter yonseiensis]
MRVSPSSLLALSSAVLALVSSSCGVGGPAPAPLASLKPKKQLYKWYDDGGEGKVSVRISLTDQIAEFKRGDRDIGWCYVATGKEGHGTSDGSYKITEKIEDKYSNRYGWFEDEYGNVTDGDAKYNDKVPAGMVYVPAPMPYWMRLTSYGIGMHGGLIPEPGKPASHGCIRLPKEFVPLVYDVVSVGTPVVITHAPSRRSERDLESHDRQQPWTMNRGGDGSVESVTYRNGMPIMYR